MKPHCQIKAQVSCLEPWDERWRMQMHWDCTLDRQLWSLTHTQQNKYAASLTLITHFQMTVLVFNFLGRCLRVNRHKSWPTDIKFSDIGRQTVVETPGWRWPQDAQSGSQVVTQQVNVHQGRCEKEMKLCLCWLEGNLSLKRSGAWLWFRYCVYTDAGPRAG